MEKKLTKPKYKIGDIIIFKQDVYAQAVITRAYLNGEKWNYWINPEIKGGWIEEDKIIERVIIND